MGGFTVQYMHQAVHLMACALLGAVNAANPKAKATNAKTSTRTLNLFKSFIMSYHLLSDFVGEVFCSKFELHTYAGRAGKTCSPRWHLCSS
jgi:hypothetical protein